MGTRAPVRNSSGSPRYLAAFLAACAYSAGADQAHAAETPPFIAPQPPVGPPDQHRLVLTNQSVALADTLDAEVPGQAAKDIWTEVELFDEDYDGDVSALVEAPDLDEALSTDVVLDSPNFVPKELAPFGASGFARKNRWK